LSKESVEESSSSPEKSVAEESAEEDREGAESEDEESNLAQSEEATAFKKVTHIRCGICKDDSLDSRAKPSITPP
jgi:hypothetical protein